MADIKKSIDGIDIDLGSIADPLLRVVIQRLLNIVEAQAKTINELKEENQRLRDENNRLKGEQGKPNIRKQSEPKKDISSEKERKKKLEKKRRVRQKKKNRLSVKRVVTRDIDRAILPDDVIFKGWQSVIIQDIIITPDNVEFKKAVYYSPSLKKTFVASLPEGYRGAYGPNIKALILDLHHNGKMTESAIHGFLENHQVIISAATVSRILTNGHDDFHAEKEAIFKAGLASTFYQQIDDTSARVGGKNHHTHILCNPFYTAYFTRPSKDRLTVIDILTPGEMRFRFDTLTYALMEQMNLSPKRFEELRQLCPQEIMNRGEVDGLLEGMFPNPKKHLTARRIILEASAISAYQQLPSAIPLLMADDAPQFRQITRHLALCWIHDGRHYKKLDPVIPMNRQLLDNFLDKYWDYYHALLEFKKQPSEIRAELLSIEFDTLFSTQTGYTHLDERIEKTRAKKSSLLLGLKYHDIPLHNNASELGARTQARYRDISFHNINQKGVEGKDTFMTIVETAKKLAVNTYKYFYDRTSRKFEMPSLASMIEAMASR